MKQFLSMEAMISTDKKGIETLAQNIVANIKATPILDNHDHPVSSPQGGTEGGSIPHFAIARALQAAAELAAKKFTEDAINEALSKDADGNPNFPGAAQGNDFTCNGEKFRLLIHNEYPYESQFLLSQDGSRREDPNSALWRAETAAVNERKEKNKVSTKRLAALEATLRQDHPRMKPTETTVSIQMRNK